MDALLRYAVVTEPFPLRAGAKGVETRVPLKVIATNPSPDPDDNPVDLQAVIIALPIGTAADQLTDDAVGIGPVAPPGWDAVKPNISTGLAEFTFEPHGGTASVGRQSLVFGFNNVVVNTEPGLFDVDVTERTGDCDEGDCPVVDVSVTKFPDGWGDVAFWTVPTDVPRGGAVALHWAGPDGATYTIDFYDWRRGRKRHIPEDGTKLLASGAYPGPADPALSLVRETVFTLNVEMRDSGHPYVAQDQKIVTVEDDRVQIVSMKGVPGYVAPGGEVALQWKTQSATAWSVSGPGLPDTDVPVPEPDAQGFQVQPGYAVHPEQPGSVGYTLEASDAQGNQLSAVAPVTVDPALVIGAQALTFAGGQGPQGPPGSPGHPPGMGGPGSLGHEGPAVAVTIGERHGMIEVKVQPDGGAAQTILVASTGHLTVQARGGKGGTGGTGASQPDNMDGWECGAGGPGGPGGPGGTVTVHCSAALSARAQAVVTTEAPGGCGGDGGPWGYPGNDNYGDTGGTGPPGTVTWVDT